MANIITYDGLKSALSQFLDKLIAHLPIKMNNKSKSDTLEVQNEAEVAVGSYNLSSSDTLMSVGNGSQEQRKNAFEIKKDGGIYIYKDGAMIKLQDNLNGGLDYESIPSIPEESINELKLEENKD
jgi:hypothetical protein